MGKWKRNLSLPRRWQKNHLLAKYGAVCYLCSNGFDTMKDITIDHWDPLSKGGADSLENYRLAHDACNSLKADLTPEDFLAFQSGSIAYKD